MQQCGSATPLSVFNLCLCYDTVTVWSSVSSVMKPASDGSSHIFHALINPHYQTVRDAW